MIESFLVTSRETLEVSLVVGIVLAYLNRTNNQNYRKSVYYGIISGILASVLAAFFFTIFAFSRARIVHSCFFSALRAYWLVANITKSFCKTFLTRAFLPC